MALKKHNSAATVLSRDSMSQRGGFNGGLSSETIDNLHDAADMNMDDIVADDQYIWGTEIAPTPIEIAKALGESWSTFGRTNADAEANRLWKQNNEKATRRGKVLTMLNEMGVDVPDRLKVASGGGGSATMTITRPPAEIVDEVIAAGTEAGEGGIIEPAPILLVPQQIRNQVPQMKGWSDDMVRAYILSPRNGYAAYLAGGGVPVQSLDNVVTMAYHKNARSTDVEHKYDDDGNYIPPPTTTYVLSVRPGKAANNIRR